MSLMCATCFAAAPSVAAAFSTGAFAAAGAVGAFTAALRLKLGPSLDGDATEVAAVEVEPPSTANR